MIGSDSSGTDRDQRTKIRQPSKTPGTASPSDRDAVAVREVMGASDQPNAAWPAAGGRAAMTGPPHVTLASLSDDDLVSLTLNGNKDAYRQLVEKYQTKVFSMAFDVLKSRQDAEDVVQESFVKAYLSLSTFKGQSSFYTWLYRIVYNMSIDLRRRTARRGGAHVEYREGPSVNRSEGGEGTLVSPEHLQNVEGPHDALARKEAGKKIAEVLHELSPEHRAVIVLREVDGLNYEEISDAIGAPRGTVMSRLHYARKALQKALREFAPVSRMRSSRENDTSGDTDMDNVTTTDSSAHARTR